MSSSATQQMQTLSRRELLRAVMVGGGLAITGTSLFHWLSGPPLKASTFIGKAETYETDFDDLIRQGLRELGVTSKTIMGKRILLKPNLVEPHRSSAHINTHPLVVRGAIDAFLHFGAKSVVVAEGPGHRHDTLLVLEDSGLADVLYDGRIPFKDLNTQMGISMPNIGGQTRMKTLTFPQIVKDVDWVVSIAKMKTHHWAGATLSMKNLFGVMPGNFMDGPRTCYIKWAYHNLSSISQRPFSLTLPIIDGVTGMEGDGPILGTPVQSGVIVMGRNLPAVDATCCRIMGLNPHKIGYLDKADQWLGPIGEPFIEQRGESWKAVHRPFQLLPDIPAHEDIRLS